MPQKVLSYDDAVRNLGRFGSDAPNTRFFVEVGENDIAIDNGVDLTLNGSELMIE